MKSLTPVTWRGPTLARLDLSVRRSEAEGLLCPTLLPSFAGAEERSVSRAHLEVGPDTCG